MNNPKSVSKKLKVVDVTEKDIQVVEEIFINCGFKLDKLSTHDYELLFRLAFYINSQKSKGIQEGRRQEVERAKNYLKRLCWNDKDIELFEKWQSRNEGSEKHGE